MAQTQVTPERFRAVKQMIAGGAIHREVAEVMDLSVHTVGMISRAASLEEYRETVNDRKYASRTPQRFKPRLASPPAPVPSPTPSPAPVPSPLAGQYQMNRIMEALKEQNEHLKLISNKLAFIVDELTK